MNRREFLKGLGLASVGLAIAHQVGNRLPVLYGDGVHDDTEVLQAWGRGESVQWDDGSTVHPTNLIGGQFKITGSIRLDHAVRIDQCHFLVSRKASFSALNDQSYISNCSFVGDYRA